MKKIVTVLSFVLLVLLCSACGSKKDKDSSSSLAPTPAPATLSEDTSTISQSPATETIAVIKDADPELNIRAEPSTDSERLSTAENGARFRLVSAAPENNWYKIHYNGGVAYLFADFVQLQEVSLSEAESLSSSTTSSSASSSSSTSADDPGSTASGGSSTASTPQFNIQENEDGEAP